MLTNAEPVHVRDISVTNYYQTDSPQTLLRVHLYIQSYLTGRNKGRTLTLNITDPGGESIITQKKSMDFPLAFRQEVEFTFDQTLEEAKLWSPGHPELYDLQLSMNEKGQKQGELVSATFGIRSATFTDSVLVINHDTIVPKIAGQQWLIQQFKLSDEELLQRFEERGYKAVQTNEPIPARLMELFDRHGIVVLKKEKDRDTYLDRPDVNRPSVVWTE